MDARGLGWGVRPFLNRLTTPQDPTQSFLTARSCGNFSGLARTPKIPGLCSRSRAQEIATRCPNRLAIGAWCRCQVAGHPPRFGTRRRPRRSATSRSRCRLAAMKRPNRRPLLSFSSLAPSRSRRLCPAVRGFRPLHARLPPYDHGISGPRNRPAADRCPARIIQT